MNSLLSIKLVKVTLFERYITMNQKQNEKMKLKLLSEIKTDLECISTLKLKRI